ncbi:MAG: cupin domain-containing protein [Acidimicrobiia bacterium]
MVRRGAVFDLPTQGETFEILETPEETGDRYVARATFAPHARGPSAHRHPGLEERFEVVSGKMELRVGRQRRELTAGQTAVVSPGVVHDLWNPTDEPAVMVGEIVFTPLGLRPEADVLEMLETAAGLARDGKINPRTHAPKNLLQAAVIAYAFREGFAFPMSIRLQRAVLRPLAALGRFRGFQST